jgi:hypothetical protein
MKYLGTFRVFMENLKREHEILPVLYANVFRSSRLNNLIYAIHLNIMILGDEQLETILKIGKQSVSITT